MRQDGLRDASARGLREWKETRPESSRGESPLKAVSSRTAFRGKKGYHAAPSVSAPRTSAPSARSRLRQKLKGQSDKPRRDGAWNASASLSATDRADRAARTEEGKAPPTFRGHGKTVCSAEGRTCSSRRTWSVGHGAPPRGRRHAVTDVAGPRPRVVCSVTTESRLNTHENTAGKLQARGQKTELPEHARLGRA